MQQKIIKQISFFLMAMIVFVACCNTKEQQISSDANEEQILCGNVSRDSLLAHKTFGEAYKNEYNSYIPNKEILTDIKEILTNRQINAVVVLATWCPDAKKQVPIFLKIIDETNPNMEISFICVDRSKKAKNEDLTQLKIERIPTFIFYENNQELGRIIETPDKSFEEDLNTIIK